MNVRFEPRQGNNIKTTDVASIWSQVARLRKAEGDPVGAARARRQARIYRQRSKGAQS